MVFKSGNIPWNKGLPSEQQPNFDKKFSLEHNKKISESKKGKLNFHMQGSKHPNWKGGMKGYICLQCHKNFYRNTNKSHKFCSLNCTYQSELMKEIGKKVGKYNLGKKLSEIARKNIRDAKLSEKNPMWKGDGVGCGALHLWVKRNKPKPDKCQNCKSNKPYDLANISGEYKRDINDFEWLCRKCHMTKDGRINKWYKESKNYKKHKLDEGLKTQKNEKEAITWERKR